MGNVNAAGNSPFAAPATPTQHLVWYAAGIVGAVVASHLVLCRSTDHGGAHRVAAIQTIHR